MLLLSHIAEICSFEMVCDITLIYQQTVCFFTADLASWFLSKLQSVAVMTSSRKCLLEDKIEQSFLEEQLLIRVVLVTMMTQVGPMI